MQTMQQCEGTGQQVEESPLYPGCGRCPKCATFIPFRVDGTLQRHRPYRAPGRTRCSGSGEMATHIMDVINMGRCPDCFEQVSIHGNGHTKTHYWSPEVRRAVSPDEAKRKTSRIGTCIGSGRKAPVKRSTDIDGLCLACNKYVPIDGKTRVIRPHRAGRIVCPGSRKKPAKWFDSQTGWCKQCGQLKALAQKTGLVHQHKVYSN